MSIPAAVLDADLREHLGMAPGDASPVSAFATSATAAAEGTCGVGPIVQRTVTERVTTTGSGALVLSRPPVVSISSIASAPSGAPVAGPFDLSSRAGIVYGMQSGTYTVTYLAGRVTSASDVPGDLAMAILIIAKHLYETRRGQSSRPSSLGESEPVLPYGFAIPRRAEELLAPHRQYQVT